MNQKIFVGSIPASFKTEELLKYFQKYGELEGFSETPQNGNKDHICGILICQNEMTVKRILENKHILKGQVLDCHIFLKGNKLKKYLDELNKRNIYVTEIPYECTYNQLKCVFGKFGKIQNIKFLLSKKVREKYAIVTFVKAESAQAALQKRRVRGLGCLIKIKIFKDKNTKRKLKFQLNYDMRMNNGSFGSSQDHSGNGEKVFEYGGVENKERRILEKFTFNQKDRVHELFWTFRWNSPAEMNHHPENLRLN